MKILKEKKYVTNKVTSIAIVITLINFCLMGCSNSNLNAQQSRFENQNNTAVHQGTTTSITNTSITAAAEQVTPAVVGITTTRIEKDLYSQNQRVQGVGSGVIVDNKGYILTNNHVAGNAESLVVSLYDGRNVKGQAVWTDPVLDLAIVKINADNLKVATLGDSKNIKVGQNAIAIGNPLGLTFQRTVTAGIISALNRTIEVEKGTFMEDLIQTDASINPGNSGGPLINERGEVVGINTIKVTTAEGMGFAVPVNVVKPVVAKVVTGGNYGSPNIGLQAFDKELGKIFDFVIDKGVYVYECKDGACSHKAGVRKGDIILSVDGKAVNTVAELKEALNSAGAGKIVKLRVKNGDGEKDVHITLDGMKK